MKALAVFAVTLGVLSTGCVGWETDQPPIVGIRNMYNQPRYDTQEKQPFFPDHRSMRPQVEGTVSREMPASLAWATGRTADGEHYVLEVPSDLVRTFGGTGLLVKRGQDRYNIYCAPCHSLSGNGKGMIARRADQLGAPGLAPPTFHDDRLRHIPDGQIFATITNGVRNMPSYAHNLPFVDRWAVVMYVRALQLSQAPTDEASDAEQTQ